MAQFQRPNRSLPVRWRGSLDGLVSDEHPARFIWTTLCDLDFSELEAQYPSVHGGCGRSPYHPRLLVALWVYGMMVGLETAAALAEACRLRDDFKWLAGGLYPCDQTLLNIVTRARTLLVTVWIQLLQAMANAGLIDLSVVVEDGTKVRVNAGPRSFHTLDGITEEIDGLKERLERRLARLEQDAGALDRRAAVQLTALRGCLERAEHAERELRERMQKRHPRSGEEPRAAVSRPNAVYGAQEFRQHPGQDALICPAGEELRLIGEYHDGGRGARYRLYGRSDCAGCPLKEKCTRGRARRVKVPVESAPIIGEQTSADTGTAAPASEDVEVTPAAEDSDKAASEPTASLTEPEANWMRATSRKRWEPCFNADLTVTASGVIVSQFLTKDTTDYHHFGPAVEFVRAHLGQPGRWIGDGHYSTAANLVLAQNCGVELFAPRTEAPAQPPPSVSTVNPVEPAQPRPQARASHTRADFVGHPDRDALLCPAGEELRFMGEYESGAARGGTYLLYGRSDCTGCRLKEQCTQGKGRRVKLPHRTDASEKPTSPARTSTIPRTGAPPAEVPERDELAELVRALEQRMSEHGAELMRLRGTTVELVNAHLKQHGLGRLHLHGLARCAAVLTLACIAHNLAKWAARLAALRAGLAP